MATVKLDPAKGVQIPNMTTTERNAVSSPETGALVWNTTTSAVNEYNGSAWKEVLRSDGSAASLTAIPAGNLTGTVADARISALTSSKLTGNLPALNASSLTNIPAANITGTLPAISGANLTGLVSTIAASTDATVSSSDPVITTNPGATGHLWINKTSGESYVCTDATTGENVWTNIGSGAGNVEPFAGHTATGGTITTHGNYKVHTFLSSGTFEITTLGDIATVDVMLVAGGGSGATYTASGGYGDGVFGNDTTGFGLTAIKGGKGGRAAGGNGGSGGGGGTVGQLGGVGTAGQGNDGGDGSAGTNNSGGGGGGAGAAGTDGTNSPRANGVGGIGIQNNYRTGSNVYYGGGGGGASADHASGSGGAGGNGGGGAGNDPSGNGTYNSVAGNGTANTGGGGGAGDYGWGAAHGGGGAGGVLVNASKTVTATSYSIVIGAGGIHSHNTAGYAGYPGNGGSGIVVIRYLIQN